jgi:hypothetical protein
MSAFNQKPIRVTAPMTQSFWAILRGLNLLPPVVPGQVAFGKPIKVISIKWIDPGQNASFSITDASASNNILSEGDTGPDFVGADPQYLYTDDARRWRDWQVVVLTGGELEIDYR